jgi:hypothetical protein
MAGVVQEVGIPGRPGPSVQELLSRERRPVAPALRQEFNDCLGTEDLDKGRYYVRDFYRLEVERMWNRVWQMACRVEEIPSVGDHLIYEVGDYSLIVARSSPTTIKAFHNACLHRGRILRETLASLNAAHVAVDTTRHPGMHRTRSIDYVVVLAGKVRMLLDEGEVD